jgi:hypothetical protein
MGDFVYMVGILYIYVYMMYLDYYKELLVEQLSLKFDGSKNFSDDQKREAKSVLMNYIRSGYQYYSDNFGKLMINRYDFILKDIRDNWRETIYRFDYVGKGGRESSELRYPNTDVEGLKNWRRDVRKYRDIKDVIEGIPENPNSAYRGMSFEELVDAKRKGYFQSSGMMNIGDSQVGYTFFGDTPSTARYYSGGFQPIPSSVTRNKPGVIIEVPKSILQKASTVKSSKTNKPVGSENEYVTDKRIEFSDILNLWLLVPERSGHGTIEVIYDKHNKKYSEGSRYSAGVDYKLMHKKGMI